MVVRAFLSPIIFFSDEKILNMELDLLFGKFENDKTSQEIQEHIRAMSCGKAAFRAKTLGFVYHRLSTKKRRAIQDSAGIEPQETPEPPRSPSPEPSFDEPQATVFCARIQLTMHVYTISELLYGLYCPACGEGGRNGRGEIGRPFTRCGNCKALRDTLGPRCSHCNILFKSE